MSQQNRSLREFNPSDKILACVDSGPMAGAVCDAAAWASDKVQHAVLLLHALEKNQRQAEDNLTGSLGLGARSALLNEMAQLDEQRNRLAMQAGKLLLEQAQQRMVDQGYAESATLMRHGGLVPTLVDLEDQARLIVLGRIGQGHAADFRTLGSQVESVIRQVHTPVLITTRDFTAPQHFMLAYDGRETADMAVERIVRGGLLHGMTCHLVSVFDGDEVLKVKHEQTALRLQREGFDVRSSYLECEVYATLMRYKQHHGIDLLVMGAFGHGPLHRFMRYFFVGNLTMRMIEQSEIPLLILTGRSDGIMPITDTSNSTYTPTIFCSKHASNTNFAIWGIAPR